MKKIFLVLTIMLTFILTLAFNIMSVSANESNNKYTYQDDTTSIVFILNDDTTYTSEYTQSGVKLNISGTYSKFDNVIIFYRGEDKFMQTKIKTDNVLVFASDSEVEEAIKKVESVPEDIPIIPDDKPISPEETPSTPEETPPVIDETPPSNENPTLTPDNIESTEQIDEFETYTSRVVEWIIAGVLGLLGTGAAAVAFRKQLVGLISTISTALNALKTNKENAEEEIGKVKEDALKTLASLEKVKNDVLEANSEEFGLMRKHISILEDVVVLLATGSKEHIQNGTSEKILAIIKNNRMDINDDSKKIQ